MWHTKKKYSPELSVFSQSKTTSAAYSRHTS